jgi:hypothetical protein
MPVVRGKPPKGTTILLLRPEQAATMKLKFEALKKKDDDADRS